MEGKYKSLDDLIVKERRQVSSFLPVKSKYQDRAIWIKLSEISTKLVKNVLSDFRIPDAASSLQDALLKGESLENYILRKITDLDGGKLNRTGNTKVIVELNSVGKRIYNILQHRDYEFMVGVWIRGEKLASSLDNRVYHNVKGLDACLLNMGNDHVLMMREIYLICGDPRAIEMVCSKLVLGIKKLKSKYVS
uniref:DUF2096 domain-containing protein n=1 Tax=Rhabditophanes sp. KR3021 TaxID=114890 RepID=A0AC35TV81_9BILA